MKRLFLTAVVLMAMAPNAFCSSQDVQKGMQLLRIHHYHDASHLLHNALATAEPSQKARIKLTLGMAYLANARFYDQLDDITRPLQIEYLQRLLHNGKEAKGTVSSLAPLYLGKSYLLSGRPELAVPRLDALLKNPQISSADRDEAAITLGSAYFAQGQKKQAEQLWSEIPTDSVQNAILLSAAYLKANVHLERAAELAKAAHSKITSKSAISIKHLSALASIFVQLNKPDKAINMLSRSDLKAYAHQEVIDTNKVLRFYEPDLLQNLALLYGRSAIMAFQAAQNAKEDKIVSAASLYIGEAYALSNQMAEATQAATHLLATITSPQAVVRRARIRKVAYGYLSQSSAAPFTGFHPFLVQNPDAALLGEIISLCAQQGIDDPKSLEQAVAAWNKSPGRTSMQLGMALGHYYRSQSAHTKALPFLEAVRDKSRKNRIEANPPELLADLAWAYYHNRQFSEALEIYFAISKQFPAVRQIQVALQGIYSMEQQSAGDAKIF